MTERAATLRGVDWERLRAASPAAADEIDRLGRLMDMGTDSDAEFGRLCELLIKHGETRTATGLLIANVEEGDENFREFQSILAEPANFFQAGVASFESQFSSHLIPLRHARFLSIVYRCEPPTSVGEEVHITYDITGVVLADAYTPMTNEGIQLTFDRGAWRRLSPPGMG